MRLRAVLVGAGKIGVGYADDPVMARHIRYATHAQVLESHPGFEWVGAVDTDTSARATASRRWPRLAILESPHGIDADVAVLATGPDSRLDVLAALPTVRGLIVEKPLGRNPDEAAHFLKACRERGIAVQVCYWRRADATFRRLADGGLEAAVGAPQAATVVYGNGLRNNGSHMIDFVRMMLGEVQSASVPPGSSSFAEGPLSNDINVPFHLVTTTGVPVAGQPLRFSHYRENGMEIWGERGRLSILQEGLAIRLCGIAPNRAMQGEREVNCDRSRDIESTASRALYDLYTNFADVVAGSAEPWSGGESALQSEAVVEQIFDAARFVGTTGSVSMEAT